MTNMDREELAERLSAYLDGELADKETELVDRLLREDEEARRLLDELRRTAALVSSLPRHRAPRSIEQDMRSQLERNELLGDSDQPSVPPDGRRWPAAGRVAVAAMLGFVVFGALWIMVDRYQPRRGAGGDVVAVAPEKAREDLSAAPLEAGPSAAERLKRRPRGVVEKKGRARGKSAVRRERGAAGEVVTRGEPFTDWGATHETQRTPKAVMAVLDVERKLAAGAGAASLRRHQFANEPVRLQVSVRDEAECDALTTRLAAHLAKHRVANLADDPPIGGAASFYYSGKMGVNFEEADERQILVRASARQIEDLVDELGFEETADDRVVLAVASVPFRGAGQARAMLRQLGRTGMAVDGKPPEMEDSDAEVTSRDGGLFAGLYKVVGLDPGAFPVAPEGVADETSKERDAKGTAVSPDTEEAETAAGEDKVAADRQRRGYAPGVPKEEDADLLPEPVSLVERRLRAIEEPRDALADAQTSGVSEESVPTVFGRGHIATPLGADVLAEEASEKLVTVVVQFIVDKPKERSTAVRQVPGVKAKPKSEKRRRSEQPGRKADKPKK